MGRAMAEIKLLVEGEVLNYYMNMEVVKDTLEEYCENDIALGINPTDYNSLMDAYLFLRKRHN